MKLIYILFITLLITSCHVSRIKKVPAEIVNISENREPIAREEQAVFRAVDGEKVEHTYSSSQDQASISEEIPVGEQNVGIQSIPETKRVKEDEPDQNDKIVQAMRAERHALLAYSELLAAFVTTLVAVFFLPMLAVAITLLILGAVQYSRGSRSRYITELGEKRLKMAKSLIILVSILSTLVIAGYTLLFILIFA